MSHEAHTFILRATNEEQAEYAAKPHHSPCLSVQCGTCYPGVADGYNASRKALDDFQLEPSAESLAKVQAEMDKLPAAPSPAAGRYPETAVRKGSQAAVSATDSPAADVEGSSASGGPREQIYVGGLHGSTGIWLGCDVTVYVGGQRGVLRGCDRITPERLRGVFVRLCHPETGRMDGGDMLYVEVAAVPVGENGRHREIISTRVVDRDQFDRMTGITDLRRDLGWRD